VTTVVECETVWVYPTVTSYAPGTYTHSEVIETVTETDYVIFCPYTSSAPAVPAPTYPASKPPPPSSKPGELGTSGTKWAITYSPFTDSGDCKSAAAVEIDIEAISKAGYTTVRIYASVCTGLVNVGAACEKYGLKMIIGVFIDNSGLGGGAAEDVHEIIAWAKWELVELIVIGNEAIFNGHCSASELAAFISTTKEAFKASGYSGPCTTTEPLDILQESYEILCEVIDITGCNIHPYFNPSVEASAAGAFVANQLSIVEGLCPGKGAVNLETGWPSKGERTSPEDQIAALKSITDAVGGKSVVLSFFNDLWKAAGDCGCESSFGIEEIVTYF
jgi:exo-beta-1,3-glucanase (GH17 family)